MKTTTKQDWRSEFNAALQARAAKCGCDISELKMAEMDTDRTWGDRTAMVFYGASAEVCERAARFFEKWASRHLSPLRSYSAQYSADYHGKVFYKEFSSGNKGWFVRERDEYSSEPLRRDTGVAVNFCYYPCAE